MLAYKSLLHVQVLHTNGNSTLPCNAKCALKTRGTACASHHGTLSESRVVVFEGCAMMEPPVHAPIVVLIDLMSQCTDTARLHEHILAAAANSPTLLGSF